jgi:hypothetical protein
MKKPILSKEFKRMQILAGILNEDYKMNEVILYATWLLNSPNNQQLNLEGDKYSIFKDQIPKNFLGTLNPNGNMGGKDVILCSNRIWSFITEPEGVEIEEVEIFMVKFKKPLTDVFLDLDDFDLESFGITRKPNLDLSKDTSLSELIPYGLNINKTKGIGWYGCYVNNISSNEIIDKKITFQNEMGGEWNIF